MADALEMERAAEALKAEGKLQEAADKFHELLEAHPDFARAHLALAVLYFNLKDADKSVHHAQQAVELEPEDQFNMVALSVTCQRAFELTKDPKYITMAETAKGQSDMMG